MAYTLREGQGSLFRNDQRGNERAPNARGEILIEGVLYEISSWTKEGSKGKFQSLQAKRKEARTSQPRDNARPVERNSYDDPFDDSDLPF
jgi:hypothetical protein